MIWGFVRLLEDLFPAIDPASARTFLKDFIRQPIQWSELFANALPREVVQGDIVGPLNFIIHDASGARSVLEANGMLISHSCDYDEDANLIFAIAEPFALEQWRHHRSVGDIRNNTFYNTLFLQNVPNLDDQVIDFGLMQSFSSAAIKKSIDNGTIKRLSSFTEKGHYFLMAKLTVRFLRPRPRDEVRGISNPPFLSRVRDVSIATAGLLRYALLGRYRE